MIVMLIGAAVGGVFLLTLAWALCRAAALEPPTPPYRVGDPTTYRKARR